MNDTVVIGVRTDGSASPDRLAAPGLRRVGPMSALQAVMQEHGFDGGAIISEQGVEPSALAEPDNFIRVSILGDLLARCAEVASCPHLGVSLGARASVASLGIVGSLMCRCDTLGDAIRALEGHLQVVDRGTLVHLEKADDAVMLGCLQYGSAGRGGGLIAESLLATIVSAFRELCGDSWAPSEVLLARRALEDGTEFRSFFRAPVRFDQELTALVFPAADLRRRLTSSDSDLRLSLEKAVRDLDRASRADLVDKVRRSLRTRLATGSCSCRDVSDRFSLHRRTLNRHLKAAGTGFRTVLDELRFEVSRQLVSDTELPLAQISAALNFSEPAAFTRAFERWSGGISPQKWRRLDRADDSILRSKPRRRLRSAAADRDCASA